MIHGSADILDWWSYANNLVSLNIKNDVSETPLSCVLNNFTLALKDSADAFVALFRK